MMADIKIEDSKKADTAYMESVAAVKKQAEGKYTYEMMEWKEVCKSIIRSNIAVAKDNNKLYSLLLEQCSRALRSKLEG